MNPHDAPRTDETAVISTLPRRRPHPSFAITTTRTTPRPGLAWALLEKTEDAAAWLNDWTPLAGAVVTLLIFAFVR